MASNYVVAGLPGNESSDSNRFTLVTPKSENDVRLQAILGNQNSMGLPVGVVSETYVLPPYGFLLEDNTSHSSVLASVVLLPYEFLLEDNYTPIWLYVRTVLLPYGFLLEDNHTVLLKCH